MQDTYYIQHYAMGSLVGWNDYITTAIQALNVQAHGLAIKLKVDSMKFNNALITIAVVMPVFWLVGVSTAHTMGGLIHLLLGISILAALARVFREDDTWA
jgi:hypothetical protein